jgi:SanA protein
MQKHTKVLLKILKFGQKTIFFLLILVLGVNLFVKYNVRNVLFKNAEKVPACKVGIVFGAGVHGNIPSNYLRDRLDASIELYKNKKVQKLLLSGDNGRDAYNEIIVMKTYCVQNGVDSAHIYLDYAGFDTYSTLFRAKHIFNIQEAILISQKYHLARAVFIGQNLGIKSIGFVAKQGNYSKIRRYTIREYAATVKSVFDVFTHRTPQFLGEKVDIDGVSNFTK